MGTVMFLWYFGLNVLLSHTSSDMHIKLTPLSATFKDLRGLSVWDGDALCTWPYVFYDVSCGFSFKYYYP